MIGFVDSPQEAYDHLSRKIEKRRMTFGYLPRPGITISVESKKTDDELRRLIKGAHSPMQAEAVFEEHGVLMGGIGVGGGEQDFGLADTPDFVVFEPGLTVVIGGDDLLDT